MLREPRSCVETTSICAHDAVWGYAPNGGAVAAVRLNHMSDGRDLGDVVP